MSRRHQSILEELNKISTKRDKHMIVESRGEHLIESAINLLEQIEQTYGEADARDLSNRLMNSIKSRDSSKFARGVRRVMKRNGDEAK